MGIGVVKGEQDKRAKKFLATQMANVANSEDN
jgi:hypothetical protein